MVIPENFEYIPRDLENKLEVLNHVEEVHRRRHERRALTSLYDGDERVVRKGKFSAAFSK